MQSDISEAANSAIISPWEGGGGIGSQNYYIESEPQVVTPALLFRSQKSVVF